MNVFEITVQRRAGDRAPVVVEYRPSGGLPVRNKGRLDLTEEVLIAQGTPLDYGRALGKALFRDDVRDAFARALSQAVDRLNVLLFVEDDKLTAWHWERLAAPIDGAWDFLSLNQRTPFSLHLPSGVGRPFPPIGRRDLRALIIAASPADPEPGYGLEKFDVGKAVAGVRAGLGEIPYAVLADIADVPDAAGPPTLDALVEHITAEPITLLHFVCHGRTTAKGETVIYLADAENRVAPVPASLLIERLGRLKGAMGLPRFAFLSTCESAAPESEAALGGLGQRLVRDLGMPAVVAMTQKVSVATADALAAAFYPRLREHGQPDLALVEAGAALAARHDITVPALYSRLGGLSLFSDTLDRSLAELTNQEIKFGLARLEGFLQERAPVLRPEFDAQTATLQKTLGTDPAGLSADALKEREQALTEINSICGEALDLRFVALALGEEPPAYDARCPFQGLPAFGYEQRAFFFGREQLIARLRERLGEHNFLAVQGPSGSGKSSLVMAGLIPALEQQHPGLRWSVIKPGDDIPQASIGNRKTEIENPPSLLVVDQFEELFTLTDTKQRQAFIDRLLAAAQAQLVVLTMRADFWGECAFYPALKAEMQAHQELIPPMDLAELHSAMEQQAGSVGLRFEADLTNTLLDDVAGEPGAMPLLQHALLELSKRRHGRWLRAEEYRALGGVRQAIAGTADGIYNYAAPEEKRRSEEQRRIRDIFLRLTRVDEDAITGEERRDTRRRVPFADLVPAGADPEPTRLLVKELADARLVVTGVNATSGQEEVEVAHEALIRYWQRLQGWLNEDRDTLRLRQNLNQDAHQWEAANRDEAQLPRWNARLEEAQVLARRGDLVLSTPEQDYLDAAAALRDREIAADRKRQRVIVGAAIVAVALAVLAVAFAIQWRKNANTAATREAEAQEAKATSVSNAATAVVASTEAASERNKAVSSKATAEANALEAQRQARIAFSRQLATQAILHRETNLSLALLLSIEANRIEQTAEARSSLLSGLAAWDPNLAARFGSPLIPHKGLVHSVTFSPDGKILASGGSCGMGGPCFVLWDVSDRRSPVMLGTSPSNARSTIWSVSFSPNGKILASGNSDATVTLWDVTNPHLPVQIGEPLGDRRDMGDAAVRSVSFSPNGKILASGSSDRTVSLWDVSSPRSAVRMGNPLSGHESQVWTVAFSPNGNILASGGFDNKVILWDVSEPQSPARIGEALTGHESVIRGVAFSPDGRTLVSGSEDRTLIRWDISNPKSPFRMSSPPLDFPDVVRSVAFSPDGNTLVWGTNDGAVVLWDASDPESATQIGTSLHGHKDEVHGLAFSPDGKTLASGSQDRTIVLWDVSLESWQALACRAANRNLRNDEWSLYLSKYYGRNSYRKTCDGLPAGE